MKKLLVLLLLPLLTGCASLVGNSTEQVTVESTPSSAYFTITDNHGQIVATGTTPQTVTLKKSDGSYFGKIEYSLAVKAEGYHSTLMPLSMRFSSRPKLSRAMTTVPGSRTAARPPTWSQWEWVRMTKRIGASVTWRSAFIAEAALS